MTYDLDPAFPFTIQDIVVHPENLSTGISDHFRIMFVRKGKIYCRFDSGGRIVSDGQMVIIPPEASPNLSIVSEIEIFRLEFGLKFLEDVYTKYRDDDIGEMIQLKYTRPEILCYLFSKSYSDEIETVLSAICRENSADNTVCRPMIRLRFIEFLILLYRFKYRNAPIESAVRNDPISEITEYIQRNYSENFSFDDIVRRSGMNATYFCRSFREKTGKSLFEYINSIRIEKACILLKRTDKTIIDIAFDAGYQNLSFFNRYFRKLMNMSPREYRNMIRK